MLLAENLFLLRTGSIYIHREGKLRAILFILLDSKSLQLLSQLSLVVVVRSLRMIVMKLAWGLYRNSI
jgi:hypothetical protein